MMEYSEILKIHLPSKFCMDLYSLLERSEQ